MKLTPVSPAPETFPQEFRKDFLAGDLFDSSCSPQARVFYSNARGGLFLKSAPKGTLEKDAVMGRHFHTLGLGPEVLGYVSRERDWLLTRKLPGVDCMDPGIMADPKRLSRLLGESLRMLHETSAAGCPVCKTEAFIADVSRGIAGGRYDPALFLPIWEFSSREEARKEAEDGLSLLERNVLCHGDYCFPNILLENWKLSGFIDVGGGGLGDRHMDLVWGLWTLNFNLNTTAWGSRFLDAYGRDLILSEKLRAIAACECFL